MGTAAGPLQVVIVLVPPGEIALRTSATTSGRYGWRIKHTNKECNGYVGQLAAVGNLPVVELFIEIVKYPLRDVETLFPSAMGRKRVGHRAGTIMSIVYIDCRSLNRFWPMDLRSIDLSGKSLPVVELLPVLYVIFISPFLSIMVNYCQHPPRPCQR